jgi:predicted nucleic acid-binding protein
MNGTTAILIDTNAVIDYLGKKFSLKAMAFMNGVIDLAPNVSVITKIEVLGFNAAEEHYQLLLAFMDDVVLMDLTPAVIDTSISIRKADIIKLPDAIIAATAVVNNFTLITRNTTDFKNISELQLLNLHEI